jgi:hypothetical protein
VPVVRKGRYGANVDREVEGVWRRAAIGGGLDARSGDQALVAVLRFHRLALRDGVEAAVFDMDPVEIQETIDGFRFFGLPGVADQICSLDVRVQPLDVSHVDSEAQAWYVSVVDEEALRSAVGSFLESRSGDFAPVEWVR